MTQHLMNHIPDYIDDRMTFDIILSDDLRYDYYNLAAARTISSWYDPDEDYAHVATSIDAVPENFKDKLVQWSANTSTNTLAFMLPLLDNPIQYSVNTTKTFKLNVKPEFEGDSLKIWWDYNNAEDQAVSTYSHDSSLSDFQHTYTEYGAHIVKFSGNLSGISLNTNKNGSTAGIKRITSRSSSLKKVGILSQSRNLEHVSIANVLSTGTTEHGEWYDCYKLTSICLPDLKELNSYAGMNCMYFLEKIYAPSLEAFNNGVGAEFKGDVSLREAVFPQLTAINSISGYNFQTCISLSNVYAPKLVKACNQEFQGCINLQKTDFSSLSAVPASMFALCMSLKSIKLPSVKSICSTAFNKCINLKTIDLSELDEVPALANVNAFTGLPDDYQILVKNSMLSQFRVAANWSNAAIINHITGI